MAAPRKDRKVNPFRNGPKSHQMKRLIHLQTCFARFAVGEQDKMHMNQTQFHRLSESLGLINRELSDRMFYALDDDKTGAMEAAELYNGMRLLLVEDPGSARHTAERTKFAFNLFDKEQDGMVSQDEIRSFLSSFYTVAKEIVEGWIAQFEEMFGIDVAVKVVGSKRNKERWRDDPMLRRKLKDREDRMAIQIELLSDAIIVFREAKEQSGISLPGFKKWCENKSAHKLNVSQWMVGLGEMWLERMGWSAEERQEQAVPYPRSSFKVGKSAGLQQQFKGISKEQIESKVFNKYCNHGHMSADEFHRCLVQLGVNNKHIRKRLFSLFDVSQSQFLDSREFFAGLERLMDDDRDKKLQLAFRLFDVDKNAFINEEEVRTFVSNFFSNASDGVLEIVGDKVGFRAWFGGDKHVDDLIFAACESIMKEYQDRVTENVFEAAGDVAPGPGGQRRVYITEFKKWCSLNGDRIKDWLDSLALHWIRSIRYIVDGVGPDGLPSPEPESIQEGSHSIIALERFVTGSDTMSALDKINKATKQPPDSGAPRIDPPSSFFSRERVKEIQDLFTHLSQDGRMGIIEWSRCLEAAGVKNSAVSERLFEMFDTSGDKEMNAKEFTCGLSDICRDKDAHGAKPTEQVRRDFAFRFYDKTDKNRRPSGYFLATSCNKFLNSWKLRSVEAVEQAWKHAMQVYNFKEADFKKYDDYVAESARLAALDEEIEGELERYTADVFRFFTSNTHGRMTYRQFTEYSQKAPVIVDWLTELGTYLERKLPKMVGMNFEDKKKSVSGSELSPIKMQNMFHQVSSGGVMNELMFVKFVCTKLGVDNSQLARRLFHVVDTSKNGSLSCDEFVDSFTTMIKGADEDKHRIAFQLHDVQGHGYLTRVSLRLFFTTFFGQSLARVDELAHKLDEWLNGKLRDPDVGLGIAMREHGLPSHYFVGAAKKKNLVIATNLRKLATSIAAQRVELMVEHAMSFAMQNKNQLYQHEFSKWLQKNKFTNFLESLGQAWMVTPEQLVLEEMQAGVGGGVGGAGAAAHGVGGGGVLDVVVTGRDVGRTVGSKIKRTVGLGGGGVGSGGGRAGVGGEGEMSSVWWARAFSNRPHVERQQVRPRTQFDFVTLADLHKEFMPAVENGRSFDKLEFREVMRDRLSFRNPLVVDRMYSMLDVNHDGTLDASEVAAGLVLMVRGERSKRLRLVFDLFDTGGDHQISKPEMQDMLQAFGSVSMEVMRGMIETLGEVFGPVPVTGIEAMEAKEFKQKILKEAETKLRDARRDMVKQAFAEDINGDNRISLMEFELWAEYNPRVTLWLKRLGVACLEVLAPLEDRNIVMVRGSGPRPVASTYRIKRKFSGGTLFDKLRISRVRSTFVGHSTYGRLGMEQCEAAH